MLTKKTIIISLFSLIPFFSFSASCPPSSVFSHSAPGSAWQAAFDGWNFDQSGSQGSSLLERPSMSLSSALLIFNSDNFASIECRYGINLFNEGIIIFDLIRPSIVSKKDLPNNFTKIDAHSYLCNFQAGNPENCHWN